MNYKKIFKNRNFRQQILKLFDFVPDKLMIRLQYFLSTGRILKFKKVSRFTEKLQWYKLNYRPSILTKCSDKYAVRSYVESKGLGDILVDLYDVYANGNDIDYETLPEKFVLKTSNGSHTNIICNNREVFSEFDARKSLNKWLSNWKGKMGREWSYYNIKPIILSELYLEKDSNDDLVDYKFFCFNGKVFCLYVIIDRFKDSGMRLGIYDKKFNKLPYRRSDINDITCAIPKPKNFNRMLEIAEILSKDFPHVRVDLYNIDGEIYFGELTFYDGSGYQGYVPDKFDFILGERFNLPTTVKAKL